MAIIINTYTAWKEETKTARLAWIFSDIIGKILHQGNFIEEWANSPLVAEALAIRETLFQTHAQGYKDIWYP